MRGDAEAQVIQFIEAWRDERDETAAFRVEQETERARERQVQRLGNAACEGVVEDDGGTGGFEREGEDAGFAGAEIAGERERRGAGGTANRDPREPCRVRQIEARTSPSASSSTTVCGITMPPASAGRMSSLPS